MSERTGVGVAVGAAAVHALAASAIAVIAATAGRIIVLTAGYGTSAYAPKVSANSAKSAEFELNVSSRSSYSGRETTS